MATYVENLIARRDKVAADLAAIDVSKPDYSIEGQSISHAANRAALLAELDTLQRLIARANGPWKIVNKGKT